MKLFTAKADESISCSWLMSMIWAFNGTKTRHDAYRGKGCIKKFCKSLEEHAMQIINFEKQKMIP